MVSGPTALETVSQTSEADPFKVLISTMLSARTRDPVTEAASDRLFAEYPNAQSLSKARVGVVKKLIKPVSFYSVKAARVIEVSRVLMQSYRGKVPENIDLLLELPGVGRKTANCVLVYAFKKPAIPVDVHVHRICNRIGLVSTKLPDQTEEELSKIYDRSRWLEVNELFVRFGQTVCKPLVPKCQTCLLTSVCRYYQTVVRRSEPRGMTVRPQSKSQSSNR